MKLPGYLGRLGYGSRREVIALLEAGRVTDADGSPLERRSEVDHDRIRIDGEPLDPPPGLVLALHKPAGHVCSTRDAGLRAYDLLPPRFLLRRPLVSCIGRLDRDTTGLLLFSDDGQLQHRILSPRSGVSKVYEAVLAEPLRGEEAALFASGRLQLRSDPKPLAPAQLQVLEPKRARLTLHEGRYHQVKRMFAATGNRVLELERIAIGQLRLQDLGLALGQWRLLQAEELERVFAPA